MGGTPHELTGQLHHASLNYTFVRVSFLLFAEEVTGGSEFWHISKARWHHVDAIPKLGGVKSVQSHWRSGRRPAMIPHKLLRLVV